MTDFYTLGSGLTDSYLAGRKQATDEAYLRAQTDSVRGLADERAYTAARARKGDAAYDAAIAAGQTPYEAGAARAALQGDITGYGIAIAAGRSEAGRAAFMEGSQLPDEQLQALISGANLGGDNGIAFAPLRGRDNKVTGYTAIVIDPSGRGTTVNLRPDQMRAYAGYMAMSRYDPEKAFAGIGQISADLAAHSKIRFDQVHTAAQTNNQALNYSQQNDNRGVMADAAMVRAGAAVDRAAAAADRLQNKQLKPEDIAKLNALNQQIVEAPDPATAAKLQAEYGRTYATAASAVGMVVPAGWMGKGGDAGPKVNPDGTVTQNGVLYTPDPKNPGKYVQAQGLGPTALETAIANATKGGAATAPPKTPVAGGKGLPAPSAPPAAPAGPAYSDPALASVDSAQRAQLQQALDAQRTLQAQAAAAMRSGDPKAVALYSWKLQAAQAAVDAVRTRMGNAAPK